MTYLFNSPPLQCRGKILLMTKVQETNHDELTQLLNPLVKFIQENNYSFFLMAGKDGICTRHLQGDFDDITGMIIGLMEKNKQFEGLINYCSEKK